MNQPAVSLMDLFRVSQFNLDDRQAFEDADIMQFEVWTTDKERIGKVSDILMDDIGQLYYIVVNIGSWLSRKLVLVEPEQFQIDRPTHRINLVNIYREDVSGLQLYDTARREVPVEFRGGTAQKVYASNTQVMPVEASLSLESSAPLGLTPLVKAETQAQPAYQSTDGRSASPAETELLTPIASSVSPASVSPASVSPASEQEIIRLLEERLVVNRLRRKVGEVVIRKEIETRIIEIPLRREKLIIEQVSPDRKHLATVDLPSQLSDDELKNFAQASLNSIEASTFISAELAQRVLANLSQRKGNSAAKVKLVFEDTDLQAEYDRQLAQIRDR